MSAPSIASYLGLRRIEALHMPVPLSIVFVGFDGDGNMHVKLSGEELTRWFGHLDHVLPHTRVELAELTCAEDGHCTGLITPGQTAPPEPVPSYVHLNFSCNVVQVRKQSVVAAFERAIHTFSRPVDPDIETGAQQVDAAKMEAFVDNFVASLGLAQFSYTLVVINPTWSISEPVYGYRLGMSQPELDTLMLGTDRVLKLMNNAHAPEPHPPQPHGGPSYLFRGGAAPRHQTKKFSSTDAQWDSERWVTGISAYLDEEEAYRKNLLKEVGQGRGAAAVVQAVRLLRRGDVAMAQVLKEELLSPPDMATFIYSKFRTSHPAEDCLVGNWVGHGRWALVDLTSGGFDWGPALGGDGVVHRHSLPSVMERFGSVAELRKAFHDTSKTGHDEEVASKVAAHKTQNVATATNRAYQAFLIESQREDRHANAPGAPEPEHWEKERQAKERDQKWQRRYQETVLKAELDVYEEFALRHCNDKSGMTPRMACSEMRTQAVKARQLLAKLASAQVTPGDVWRDHKWDIFGDEPDGTEDWGVADASERAHDMFLGELTGVLSRALRHVVAPPTATWTHAAGHAHDTATPYAQHVRFVIHVVSEVTRARSEYAPNPAASAVFDVAAFQEQVATLKLAGQTFDFQVHRTALGDDPVLATAFAAATRTRALDIPSSDDIVQEAERVYVDSRALAHVLRQRFDTPEAPAAPAPPGSLEAAAARRARRARGRGYARPGSAPVNGSATHATHEVPVFVFELTRDTAVLIDGHYNAKPLEDMVLVVSNTARDDEHPTGMMCGGALLARPLSPLKEALGAVLTHLGGVLPPHLGYDPTKKRVTHDWLWSVGSHPQSFTSVGTRYSDLQRDALARAYALDGLDSAVDAVNDGIAALAHVAPSKLSQLHFQLHAGDAREMLKTYAGLLDAWRRVMEAAWSLDWATAASLLPGVEDGALRFRTLAEKLATIPLNGQCAGSVSGTTEHLVLPMLIASIAVAAAALVHLAWPLVSGWRPPAQSGLGYSKRGSKGGGYF